MLYVIRVQACAKNDDGTLHISQMTAKHNKLELASFDSNLASDFCHILCGCINSFKSQKKQTKKKFKCRNNYRFSLVLKIQKKIKIYAKIKTFFFVFFF